MNIKDYFGDVIYAYTRQDAINDGVLVDVTELAREAGFKIPVAITAALHAIIENIPKSRSWQGGDNMQKSKGHICFYGEFEFYERDDQVYRANVSNVIDVDGYRIGRWECSKLQFKHFKEVILRHTKEKNND